MDTLSLLLDYVVHFDRYLAVILAAYGPLAYGLIFVILFCETGLVVTPFLPGDTLLFAAGALAMAGKGLDLWVLLAVCTVAAIAGDTANYWIGHYLGPKLLANPNSKVFRKEHLDRTHAFFARYGAKTIILARFVPVVRTFAPFLAGVGTMDYRRFITYNIVGGALWVGVFVLAGFLFGAIPWVEQNLSLALLIFIIVTTIPIVWEAVRQRAIARAEAASVPEPAAADVD